MDEVIEMFGKRLKVVTDESDDARTCEECALEDICWEGWRELPFCEDAEGKMNRHFEEVND